MCLLVFAWRVDQGPRLVFAGNRDERHARPAAPAGFWPDTPGVIAGRDLEAGGTWLGLTTAGRFAVVTNYREGLDPPKAPRSRGELPAEFLQGDLSPAAYLADVQRRAHEYGAFSLLCGDRDELFYFSNRGGAPAAVTPGIHGLSNHLLDTPWPKVMLSKGRLALLLEQHAATSDALFRLLRDTTPAPDGGLPDTGIGLELERRVSSPFVLHPVYGTRCSTLLRLGDDGGADFTERRFDAAGTELETRRFDIPGSAG
ncbi:MAG TPA: NRDE family protein [Gammaproteobacteria bacterium]|nr:NRDE family protein [Gammaproteobacteria bacterium]